MNKMKKVMKVFGVVFLIFIVMAVGGFFYIKNMDLPAISIGELSMADVADGSYEGDYSAGLVSAAVTVTVKDKKIQDIIINKHENGLGKKAERITKDIIEKQSVDIDNVSGATLSSNVIRKAVEQALVKQTIGTK